MIAHISKDKREQPILDHLKGTADRASEFVKDYQIPGIEDVQQYAYVMGMAHDIGKYSVSFQRRIRGEVRYVDHATAGAIELRNRKMLSASMAVAGHHGGLPNGNDTTDSCYLTRMKKEVEDYSAFQKDQEIYGVKEGKCGNFEKSFSTRMLFSALVDADFLDTDLFMCEREVYSNDNIPISILYEKLEQYIAPWLDEQQEKSEINRLRTDILKRCRSVGKNKRGIFSLTVPTGGGKTIASLAFALAHAKENKMKRIIYVIPYTSIIEQTADVFRKILGEEVVLEHHCNALVEPLEDEEDKVISKSMEEQKKLFEKHKRATENWDAQVIVTTNVQFFESLYSNKVSRCRKLHNIANSVIVFDEAQMIPFPFFSPCVKAIELLVKQYKATAVLCTATQPAMERFLKKGFVKEIYPEYAELFQKLKRTTIKSAGMILTEKLVSEMERNEQVLVIVNKKKTAQDVFKSLPQEGSFHLSTYMTPNDRRRTIAAIRERLRCHQICRVVSTSLVEAGVDLDFPTVYREISGLDSIIQAAGRCNREGRRMADESIVWVFEFEDSRTNKMFQKNISIMEETVEKYCNYDAPETIHAYFETIQNLDEEALDQYHIVSGFEKGMDGITMPFAEVEKRFKLIDTNSHMLIIPIEEETKQLVDLLYMKVREGESLKELLRNVGKFSINVYEGEYKNLEDKGAVSEILPGVAVLQDLSIYDRKVGL